MTLLTATFLTATVCTGLFLGQSAVGIRPDRQLWRLIGSGAGAVLVFIAAGHVLGAALSPGLVFLLLVPLLIFVVRMPVRQTVFTLLFAWTYQICIVYLTERNLFELAVAQAGLDTDRFIELMIELFILLNHIICIIAAVRFRAVLIPPEAFRQTSQNGKEASPYRLSLIVSAVLLVIMDVFFQYTFAERALFSGSYRLFITIWSIVLLVLVLGFMRTSLTRKLEQERLYLDQQYQQDLLSFFTVIRSQRHDFNFHLTSLYGLLTNRKYEEAKRYIGEVVQQVQEVNELLPLAHPALSAMLNTQGEAVKQQGIGVHFSIMDDLRDIPVSVYDVNKILGNLIQNAAEELLTLPVDQRQLYVEIAKEQRHYVFRVKNRTGADDVRIMHMFASGYSTKQSHEGIGLAGVSKIVEAHFGIVYPELAGDWLTIHVRIPENTDNY